MQRKTKRRRQQQQTQRQHTTEKDTTHGVRALVLAFGFSEYREKFISSGKRKDEGERTNERTNERNGTEDGHGSTATSSRCGAGSSRVTGRTGCETSATGSPGCFWPGSLPLTWRHAVIHHSSTRPQSDTNLSYLIVSPLSDRSLEGLQPRLLGLHHGEPCRTTSQSSASKWGVGNTGVRSVASGALAWTSGNAPFFCTIPLRIASLASSVGMTNSQGSIECSGRNESAPSFLPSSIGGGAFDDPGNRQTRRRVERCLTPGYFQPTFSTRGRPIQEVALDAAVAPGVLVWRARI